jgi:hypothetical protein
VRRRDEVTDIPSNQALHEYVMGERGCLLIGALEDNVHSLLHHDERGFLLFSFYPLRQRIHS